MEVLREGLEVGVLESLQFKASGLRVFDGFSFLGFRALELGGSDSMILSTRGCGETRNPEP